MYILCRYLAKDKAGGAPVSTRGGANTPLDECAPVATPRTDRSVSENSQAALLTAGSVDYSSVEFNTPRTPSKEDLGAGGSWFGTSLLTKDPFQDVRKAVERMQPSKAETSQARKGKMDTYNGMRTDSPSPPPKGGLSPFSAHAFPVAHGSPTGTLSSDSPREDGGDTTRSCTITENTVLGLNAAGVEPAASPLDTGRSYLDSGRSLASIDEGNIPIEFDGLGEDFDHDSDDEVGEFVGVRLNCAGTERANRPRKEVGIGISLEEEIGMLNADVNEIQKAYMRMSAGPERDAVKQKLKELEDEVDVKIDAVKAKRRTSLGK